MVYKPNHPRSHLPRFCNLSQYTLHINESFLRVLLASEENYFLVLRHRLSPIESSPTICD